MSRSLGIKLLQAVHKKALGRLLCQSPIKREIRILVDLIGLFRLTIFIAFNGFDIVHSVTPKAGFIAMLASRISGVRHRFHTFTGQVWATKSGWYRFFSSPLTY